MNVYGPVSPALLAGLAEVAEELRCPKQQLHSLRKRGDFPPPIAHLAATPVWDLRQIRSFKDNWQRRPREQEVA